MGSSHMEEFWDARAREDALWFVDSRMDYGGADEDEFWRLGEQSLDRLLDVLGAKVTADQTVIDLGCGVGRLTRPLAARTRAVYAIDVSGEMLVEAKRRNGHLGNVEWLHGDGSTLQPIPDASADACISHVVFRHIPDPQITLGYIKEMGRVLRPGGWSAFEFSNDPRAHRRRGTSLKARIRSALSSGPHGTTDRAWVGAHVELDAIRAAAHVAGMQLVRTVGEGTEFCAVLLVRAGA